MTILAFTRAKINKDTSMDYDQISDKILGVLSKMEDNGKTTEYQIGILIGALSGLMCDMPTKDIELVLLTLDKVA